MDMKQLTHEIQPIAHKICLLGYSRVDTEFNLAKDFKETIERAIRLFPKDTVPTIAARLGISDKTLYTAFREFDILTPQQLRNLRKQDKNKIKFRNLGKSN